MFFGGFLCPFHKKNSPFRKKNGSRSKKNEMKQLAYKNTYDVNFDLWPKKKENYVNIGYSEYDSGINSLLNTDPLREHSLNCWPELVDADEVQNRIHKAVHNLNHKHKLF